MWSPWDEPGLEHLRLTRDDDGIVADGMMLKVGKDSPLRLHYRICCDAKWVVRGVAVTLLDGHAHNIQLSTDGNGHWSDDAGNHISNLNGCLGVDISATPFTNTLAIRQLGLKPGESAVVMVAFIAVPEMEVKPSRQRYTCLDLSDEGGSYRYADEGLFNGFTADLQVDRLGLVLDYPKLFKRIPSP